MSQGVVIGNTCHNSVVSIRLISAQVGVEVTCVVIVNLITCLCLIGGNPYMVGVELSCSRLQIPQPTSTRAGAAGQLFFPTLITINIKCRITIAIRIDGSSLFCHHPVFTVFLIEFVILSIWCLELQHIGSAFLLILVI